VTSDQKFSQATNAIPIVASAGDLLLTLRVRAAPPGNTSVGIVTLPWGQARSVGGSGIFRLLRRRSAMCPSPQREARGAFGLR
jgi:hypothetical protein